MIDEALYADWLKTRPPSVQALAAEFPPLTEIEGADGTMTMVIGWTEDDKLIVSTVNPGLDYDGAIEAQRYVCAAHLRERNSQ